MNTHALLLIFFYLLGVIGLLAITLLPYRGISQLYHSYRQWQSQKNPLNLCQILLIISLVGASFYLSFFQLFKLTRCLLKTMCGASASGGWMTLCLLGLIYLGFELGLFLSRFMFSKMRKS